MAQPNVSYTRVPLQDRKSSFTSSDIIKAIDRVICMDTYDLIDEGGNPRVCITTFPESPARLPRGQIDTVLQQSSPRCTYVAGQRSFNDLPTEIILDIMQQCDLDSLRNLKDTSQKFRVGFQKYYRHIVDGIIASNISDSNFPKYFPQEFQNQRFWVTREPGAQLSITSEYLQYGRELLYLERVLSKFRDVLFPIIWKEVAISDESDISPQYIETLTHWSSILISQRHIYGNLHCSSRLVYMTRVGEFPPVIGLPLPPFDDVKRFSKDSIYEHWTRCLNVHGWRLGPHLTGPKMEPLDEEEIYLTVLHRRMLRIVSFEYFLTRFIVLKRYEGPAEVSSPIFLLYLLLIKTGFGGTGGRPGEVYPPLKEMNSVEVLSNANKFLFRDNVLVRHGNPRPRLGETEPMITIYKVV